MNTPARHLKVLVVEDEALISMVIEDALETLGYEIVGPVAKLGDALLLAQTGDFDCAVLDINITGGNTYAIAELLLARGCPFLMTTGYSEWSMPTHFASQRRLTKPYGTAELEAELRILGAKAR